jgi:hypothetical protein
MQFLVIEFTEVSWLTVKVLLLHGAVRIACLDPTLWILIEHLNAIVGNSSAFNADVSLSLLTAWSTLLTTPILG